MHTISESQHKAAKVVGATYLVVLALSMFGEFYVPGQLIDYGNAGDTARNIIANERLFRLGTAANLLAFALDVVLIAALYVVLEPVNRNFALLAVFFRLIETALLMVVVLNDFAMLRILSGAEYLQAFEPERLHSLARLAISAHNDAYRMGLLLFGFGSTVFGYLWLKSRYIPRSLAALGALGSALVGGTMLLFVVFPELTKTISVAIYAGPIFAFELSIGLWLLVRGLRESGRPPVSLAGA